MYCAFKYVGIIDTNLESWKILSWNSFVFKINVYDTGQEGNLYADMY